MPFPRFLLFSLLLTGPICCSPEEEAPPPDSMRDIQDSYLGLAPPGLVPEVFAPGLISTELDEGGAVIHPGGTEIYFWVVRGGDGQGNSTIYVTRMEKGNWTTPEVASFSGAYGDGYIAMHPDGSRLFFQSDRPVDSEESAFKYNIWYVDRVGDGWSEAKSIGRPVNGPNHTGGASVALDGTLYYTVMDLDRGASKLFRSEYVDGAYQDPKELPETVNFLLQTTDSYIAPDESYLVFTAFPRRGHEGNPGAVYVSFRNEAGEWSEAQRMGPAVNSEDQFGSVTITPDGRYLMFPRFNHSEGMGLDIYWVDSGVVEESRG